MTLSANIHAAGYFASLAFSAHSKVFCGRNQDPMAQPSTRQIIDSPGSLRCSLALSRPFSFEVDLVDQLRMDVARPGTLSIVSKDQDPANLYMKTKNA